MLITFKSKAAADVLMYEEHARPILELWHKELKRGVVTAAEMASALAALDAAIAEHRALHAAQTTQRAMAADDQEKEEAPGALQTVSFATRAYPLQEMLRGALKSGHDIAWGI